MRKLIIQNTLIVSSVFTTGIAHAAPVHSLNTENLISMETRNNFSLSNSEALPDFNPLENAGWKEVGIFKSKPKKGKLDKNQKAKFKLHKKLLKTDERAALRKAKQWHPAIKRAKRAQKKAEADRLTSKKNLNNIKIEKLKYMNENNLVRGQPGEFTQKALERINKFDTDYKQAERAHIEGPRKKDIRAKEQYENAIKQFSEAKKNRDIARAKLVMRKDNKNQVRSNNLTKANEAKILKKLRSGPIPPISVANIEIRRIINANDPAPAGAVRQPNAGGVYALSPDLRQRVVRVRLPLVYTAPGSSVGAQNGPPPQIPLRPRLVRRASFEDGGVAPAGVIPISNYQDMPRRSVADNPARNAANAPPGAIRPQYVAVMPVHPQPNENQYSEF